MSHDPRPDTQHGAVRSQRDARDDASDVDSTEPSDDDAINDSTDDSTGESTGDGTTLSPAVRRLVRTYELDVTAIRGSGPSGRIRVGDVMAALGNRAAPSVDRDERRADERSAAAPDQGDPDAAAILAVADRPSAAPSVVAAPATTVFECDVSSVLAHRQRERQRGREIGLDAYFAAACAEALRLVPELAPPAAAGSESARFGINCHGDSGSVLAVPTPLPSGHAASLGIGRPRRRVVLRDVDGQEAPRAAALCYVSLSYDPGRIALEDANRFLAAVVRQIEHWQSE